MVEVLGQEINPQRRGAFVYRSYNPKFRFSGDSLQRSLDTDSMNDLQGFWDVLSALIVFAFWCVWISR